MPSSLSQGAVSFMNRCLAGREVKLRDAHASSPPQCSDRPPPLGQAPTENPRGIIVQVSGEALFFRLFQIRVAATSSQGRRRPAAPTHAPGALPALLRSTSCPSSSSSHGVLGRLNHEGNWEEHALDSPPSGTSHRARAKLSASSGTDGIGRLAAQRSLSGSCVGAFGDAGTRQEVHLGERQPNGAVNGRVEKV